jgi:hypothetical protein
MHVLLRPSRRFLIGLEVWTNSFDMQAIYCPAADAMRLCACSQRYRQSFLRVLRVRYQNQSDMLMTLLGVEIWCNSLTIVYGPYRIGSDTSYLVLHCSYY